MKFGESPQPLAGLISPFVQREIQKGVEERRDVWHKCKPLLPDSVFPLKWSRCPDKEIIFQFRFFRFVPVYLSLYFSLYRDFTWDVNDYLLGLREEVKSWKEVYWRWDFVLLRRISVRIHLNVHQTCSQIFLGKFSFKIYTVFSWDDEILHCYRFST